MQFLCVFKSKTKVLNEICCIVLIKLKLWDWTDNCQHTLISNCRYRLSISLETILSMISTGTSWKQSYAGQKILWASPS